jgi:glutaredoxin
MDAAMTRKITLYTRPGCHLCEDAADLIEHLAGRFPLEVVEVSILSDAGLYERYKHSIPVIVIAGGPTIEAPIREAELIRWLTRKLRMKNEE